jgi:hypothetical protein
MKSFGLLPGMIIPGAYTGSVFRAGFFLLREAEGV